MARRRKSPWSRVMLVGAGIWGLMCVNVLAQNGVFSPAQWDLGEFTLPSWSAQQQEPEWNLILVNRDNEIPADFEIPAMTLLSNGEQVDSRMYPDLQEMFDTARAQGYGLFVASGYRTQEKQQQLLDDKIAAYEYEGHSREEAESLAREWVAIPGTSEHQLGLAVDINADTNVCSSDGLYAWLAAHAHEYGFILRYPAGKTEITGFQYEPWHFRYVGREAAEEIQAQGLTLEEYLNQA